jgi:hypothetical protein
MIDIDKAVPGRRVRFEGDEGVITRVDYDEPVIWIDFAPDDSTVDGLIDVSPDEPHLELLP